jgi:folate-binding protein YgfZ
MTGWVHLHHSRTFIQIEGERRVEFLQGMLTQDVHFDSGMIFGAFLTPKGRFLADAFVWDTLWQGLWLDIATQHVDPLMNLLLPYGLLHQVTVQERPHHWAVCVHPDPKAAKALHSEDDAPDTIIAQPDPRTPVLGTRSWISQDAWPAFQQQHQPSVHEDLYHSHRISLGIPDGYWDLIPHQSIILEYGYHHLNALSWTKGCYRGQELMARTHHRGLVRKQIAVLNLLSGHFPAPGTLLNLDNKQDNLPTPVLPEDTPPSAGVPVRGWMGGHLGSQGLACLPDTLLALAGSQPVVLTHPSLDDTSSSFTVLCQPGWGSTSSHTPL